MLRAGSAGDRRWSPALQRCQGWPRRLSPFRRPPSWARRPRGLSRLARGLPLVLRPPPRPPRVLPRCASPEPTALHEVGTEFALPPGAVELQGRALVLIDGEAAVLKYLGLGSDVSAYVRERKAFLGDDPRVVPFATEATTFAMAVDQMRKVDRVAAGLCRSPLSGPETAAEWLSEVRRQGHLSLVARHERWASESGVLRASAACYEHEVISRCAQAAITADGLNLFNLASFELLLRRPGGAELRRGPALPRGARAAGRGVRRPVAPGACRRGAVAGGRDHEREAESERDALRRRRCERRGQRGRRRQRQGRPREGRQWRQGRGRRPGLGVDSPDPFAAGVPGPAAFPTGRRPTPPQFWGLGWRTLRGYADRRQLLRRRRLGRSSPFPRSVGGEGGAPQKILAAAPAVGPWSGPSPTLPSTPSTTSKGAPALRREPR